MSRTYRLTVTVESYGETPYQPFFRSSVAKNAPEGSLVTLAVDLAKAARNAVRAESRQYVQRHGASA